MPDSSDDIKIDEQNHRNQDAGQPKNENSSQLSNEWCLLTIVQKLKTIN